MRMFDDDGDHEEKMEKEKEEEAGERGTWERGDG